MKKTIEDLVRDGFHIPVAGDIYPFYGRRFLVAAGSNYPCIDCSFADKDCPETVRCDNEISGIYFMVITSAEDNHESGSGGIGKERETAEKDIPRCDSPGREKCADCQGLDFNW